MTKLHRKDLKQDEIREKVSEAVHSASLHSKEIVYIILIVLGIGAIAAGWYYYGKSQQEKSQNLLGLGMEKLNGSVGPQTPENPNPNPNHFNTDAEKYRAALKDFQQVINQYGSTNSADMAQYEAGICEFYLGEYPKAENFLKESAKVRETNILYYQSRVALADLYNVWGKPDRAIEVLNEALNAKQNLVPSEYLLMEKGASYEKAGKKKEAIQTYQKILSEYKDSPISYQAQMRLSEVSGK